MLEVIVGATGKLVEAGAGEGFGVRCNKGLIRSLQYKFRDDFGHPSLSAAASCADLLDAMKESLRGLKDLKVLSPNKILRLKHSLKKTIAELEGEEFQHEEYAPHDQSRDDCEIVA